MIFSPVKMGPLKDDHPLIKGVEISGVWRRERCPGCKHLFKEGDYVTLVGIGPGDDPEARAKHRAGRPYNAIAIPAHWACVTGEEDDVPE